ncbi:MULTISPECIES: hypothetical protein [Streptomyces]|uniref:Uncharacterized protein n=1 Tax=Streptomyces heilongjiangensis TaxID=945052 RepID=A0ABW1BJY1_9ACTN|nr:MULTISPECIES: hypothetical protein [Streptomyces]MDC2945399.1 hypothetical protein [Streptomyces heilongjiangensis]
MTEQRQGQDSDRVLGTQRRRAGIVAFLLGLVVTLAFFAFFPGLPHVIDWGAILVALAVGGVARWACLAWVTKATKKPERR